MNKKLGIINLNSNFVKLVIYEINSNGSYKLIDDIIQPISLIENMVEGKNINDFSIHKAIKIVKLYRKICLSYKITPSNIMSIITSSIKSADNYNQLMDMLNKYTGLEFKLLTEDEETLFINNSVKYSFESNNSLIININGGNTHLIYSQNNSILNSIFIPIGYINANESYLSSDNHSKLKNKIFEILSSNHIIKSYNKIKVIGIGDITLNLSKILIEKNTYPLKKIHNYTVYFKDLNKLLNKISSSNFGYSNTLCETYLIPNIFTSGLFILKTILEYYKFDAIIINSNSLDEGIFFNYFFKNSLIKFTNVLNFSINNYINNLNLQNITTNNIVDISLSLFNQLKPIHNFGINEEKILHYSSLLHEIGMFIDYKNNCDNTFYILLNLNIYGLSHREIILLSAISASHKNLNRENRYLKPFKDILNTDDIKIYKILSLFLNLSKRLNKSNYKIIESIDCTLNETSIKIKTIHNGDAELEITLANEISDEFIFLFNKKLIVT
ncbi:MAG: hypothetical protein ABF289_11915 [Clostridiales bacterium]